MQSKQAMRRTQCLNVLAEVSRLAYRGGSDRQLEPPEGWKER